MTTQQQSPPDDEPVGRMALAPWMADEAARRVLKALEEPGRTPRFIGGCVRDALLERPVKDIDIATPLAPEEVMRRLRTSRIKAVPTGLDHGTVTAVSSGKPFEITTLRVDVETDGRHAKVAFTDDWRADAARRDFTVNAMSCDEEGRLWDYFGGREDLAVRRIRFVGDPSQRIAEDYLRILRFFRFHAWYGEVPPAAAALAACEAAAPRLAGLSAERIGAEMQRLLTAPDPHASLRLMAEHGVLHAILPEAVLGTRFEQLLENEHMAGAPPEAPRRLAALFLDADTTGRAAARLRWSNRERRQAVQATALATSGEGDTLSIPALLYRYGAEAAADANLITGPPERAQAVIVAARDYVRPQLPVGGADVMAAGAARGPQIGVALRAVEDWWIESGFKPDREACLTWLRSYFEQ